MSPGNFNEKEACEKVVFFVGLDLCIHKMCV
jgi:hypothetical protein